MCHFVFFFSIIMYNRSQITNKSLNTLLPQIKIIILLHCILKLVEADLSGVDNAFLYLGGGWRQNHNQVWQYDAQHQNMDAPCLFGLLSGGLDLIGLVVGTSS